jgi:hypothetical protein
MPSPGFATRKYQRYPRRDLKFDIHTDLTASRTAIVQPGGNVRCSIKSRGKEGRVGLVWRACSISTTHPGYNALAYRNTRMNIDSRRIREANKVCGSWLSGLASQDLPCCSMTTYRSALRDVVEAGTSQGRARACGRLIYRSTSLPSRATPTCGCRQVQRRGCRTGHLGVWD